jgi:hypothetical protein
MKINFTKKDYLTLLEILHIAAWVLHAHRTDEPEDQKKYREFEQWIFSFAKGYGCENLVDFDSKSGRYWPTREHDVASPVMAFIEEYNDETFWDELKDRLVDRDLCRELGEQKFSSLPIEQRFAKEEPYINKYEKEFETYGITRLQILPGPAAMNGAGPVRNN